MGEGLSEYLKGPGGGIRKLDVGGVLRKPERSGRSN